MSLVVPLQTQCDKQLPPCCQFIPLFLCPLRFWSRLLNFETLIRPSCICSPNTACCVYTDFLFLFCLCFFFPQKVIFLISFGVKFARHNSGHISSSKILREFYLLTFVFLSRFVFDDSWKNIPSPPLSSHKVTFLTGQWTCHVTPSIVCNAKKCFCDTLPWIRLKNHH